MEQDDTYIKIAHITYSAYWYDLERWIAQPLQAEQFLSIQPDLRLFHHQTPSGQDVLLPVGLRSIIPSRQVWEQIKEGVDAFFSAYSQESLDNHNWESLSRRVENDDGSISGPSNGFVYLFRAGDIYKIGLSINPKQRSKAVKAPNGQDIIIEHQISTDDMGALEQALHYRFSDKRLEGEWFELTDSDVEYVKGL